MRPSLLDPLFAPVRTLPGVGPRVEAVLKRLLGTEGDPLVRDLLLHLPHAAIDRSRRLKISELGGQRGVVTVAGVVERHDVPPKGSRAPWRTIVSDGNSTLEVIFFNLRPDWLKKALPVGEERLISGTLDWYDFRPQIAHPDYILPLSHAAELPAIEPVYPLTAGLSGKVLRRAITAARDTIPDLPEWHEPTLAAREGWPSFANALALLHAPDEPGGASPDGPAWRRLAADELLASQLALMLVRASMTRRKGRAWPVTGRTQALIRKALPFSLTTSQEAAVAAIVADLKASDRMLRLLQGDVGSGKTVVALIAMAAVAEAGGQAVLMAPTDLLARQHFETIRPLAEAAGLVLALLTGRDARSVREAALAAIEGGSAKIIVGTHALFQAGVTFRDLGLIVVDEQHRFGVHQRLALSAKGAAPDMLVMTATPIPRTLVLTYYGDMDATQLTEKPAGRQSVETRSISLERLGDVVARLRAAIDRGEKAYWVCPLVSESDVLDVTAAEERHAALRQALGERVGLVHGRLPARDKDAVMEHFRAGDLAVLVATTVVEVGVDVPDATIMVVEHAERFGLAQLHQLRGRVGRGEKPSACLLIYRPPLGDTARARLTIMRETEDGFRIAEEDLRLRGEGDLLGARQSGMPGFRVALADRHGDLIEAARDAARMLLATDPDFRSPRAEALRLLLYLFGRDDAVRLMRAG